MKRPTKATEWIGVAVALLGCAAAVIFFGWVLVP